MFTQVSDWMTSKDISQKIAQNTLGFSEDRNYASKILVGSLMYQNWSTSPNFGNETILEAGSTFFFFAIQSHCFTCAYQLVNDHYHFIFHIS